MFISKKNFIAAVALSVVALVLVAVIATNLIRGHRKKVEDERIAVLVADATTQLRQTLAAGASGANVAKFEEYLQSAKGSSDAAAGAAAESYLLGARGIARQRAEGQRLTREVAAARSALNSHMARAERRNTNWIRNATDLKRRFEARHADLERSLKTLDGLLGNLYETEKRLAPHVAASAMLQANEIEDARKRVQDELQRAAAELEQVRRIGF